MAKIKLSAGAREILECLVRGKALAVSKTDTKAYLVFGDYSFYKDVHHWDFDTLKDAGFLKKIDSRVASTFYSISEKGTYAIENPVT